MISHSSDILFFFAILSSQLSAAVPAHAVRRDDTIQIPNHSTCYKAWTGGYDYYLTIVHKTTPETGALGSGLHDNLNGLCGKNGLTWPTPMPIPGGYHVSFEVDEARMYDNCVESAIWVAEQQNVTCFLT